MPEKWYTYNTTVSAFQYNNSCSAYIFIRCLADMYYSYIFYWSAPYYRIWLNLLVWGFHRTFATGAACQQRKLTPLDTWSCPTLGLAWVLMSRPITPELVLFPDFWVSNIPRYFCFAQRVTLTRLNTCFRNVKEIIVHWTLTTENILAFIYHNFSGIKMKTDSLNLCFMNV